MIYIGTYEWKKIRLSVHQLDEQRVQLCYLMMCRVITTAEFHGALALGLIERIIN